MLAFELEYDKLCKQLKCQPWTPFNT